MENMDKEPTVPKWVLINRPNLSAQAKKFGIFKKKLSLGVRSPWSKVYTDANERFFFKLVASASYFYDPRNN